MKTGGLPGLGRALLAAPQLGDEPNFREVFFATTGARAPLVRTAVLLRHRVANAAVFHAIGKVNNQTDCQPDQQP